MNFDLFGFLRLRRAGFCYGIFTVSDFILDD